MKTFLVRFAEKLLYGNLLIASAAFLLTTSTYIIFNCGYTADYSIMVFYATLALYNIHRIISIRYKIIPNELGRISRLKENETTSWILFAIGIVLSSYTFLNAHFYSKLFFYLPLLLAFSYSLPRPFLSIRDIPYCKPIFVSITWILVCIYIPSKLSQIEIPMAYYLMQFAFIMGLTIPFEYRDKELDALQGTKTIATEFGHEGIITLSALSLLISQLSNFFLYGLGYFNQITTVALMSFYIFTFLIIQEGVAKSRSDLFYIGILDALIVIQAFLIYLFINV